MDRSSPTATSAPSRGGGAGRAWAPHTKPANTPPSPEEKPLTCDDLVLAWAAQSGRFPGFDAATQAGYVDIANVECIPGQKKARESFGPDRGVVDYNQLFAPTTMMPSHVIA